MIRTLVVPPAAGRWGSHRLEGRRRAWQASKGWPAPTTRDAAVLQHLWCVVLGLPGGCLEHGILDPGGQPVD